MTFFNEKVLATLRKHGVTVTEQEIENYTKACDEVEQKGILGHKTKKSEEEGRPHSIFHAVKEEKDRKLGQMYEHWLVLRGLINWETKDEEHKYTVAKLYINLETGEEWFTKVHRPEMPSDNSHLMSAFLEQTNNELMNVESKIYTRYDWSKGTKSYSMQRYIGKRNLFDLLEDPNTGPTVLHDVLIQSGERLHEIHQQGYLHADFKPQNIVYKEENGKIQVIDFETLMSKQIGKEGIEQIRGTPKYLHPQWYKESLKNRVDKKPVYYDARNDVFAYLVMAKLFMDKACEREPDIILKSSLHAMAKKIDGWKSKPMKDMPTLEQVLDCLKSERPTQAITMKKTM